MSSATRSFSPIKILLWLASVALGVAGGYSMAALLLGDGPKALAWEDVLTTAVGVWMLLCIPISLLRWAFVPAARIEGTLANALISMGLTGVSLTLPVLSQGLIDSSIAFLLVLILFAGQAVMSLVMHRKADEMMRRYNTDSSVIGAALLIGGFSIYAAGERMGVIATVSPWGLVGIACIVQFTVSFYVYYRLGLDPDAQEKTAAG